MREDARRKSFLGGLFTRKKKTTRCPRCGEGVRVGRTNKASGETFTGCSEYPLCRYTEGGRSRTGYRGSVPQATGYYEKDYPPSYFFDPRDAPDDYSGGCSCNCSCRACATGDDAMRPGFATYGG